MQNNQRAETSVAGANMFLEVRKLNNKDIDVIIIAYIMKYYFLNILSPVGVSTTISFIYNKMGKSQITI